MSIAIVDLLQFQGCYIEDEGAVAISDALMINNTITYVDLGCLIHSVRHISCLFLDNGIGARGAAALCDVLRSNTTITRLDLDGFVSVMLMSLK